MDYSPSDGTWPLGEQASLLSEMRQRMTPEAYEQEKQALQEFLCGYFSSGDCRHAQGSSISPLKATPQGGKGRSSKVRKPGKSQTPVSLQARRVGRSHSQG